MGVGASSGFSHARPDASSGFPTCGPCAIAGRRPELLRVEGLRMKISGCVVFCFMIVVSLSQACRKSRPLDAPIDTPTGWHACPELPYGNERSSMTKYQMALKGLFIDRLGSDWRVRAGAIRQQKSVPESAALWVEDKSGNSWFFALRAEQPIWLRGGFGRWPTSAHPPPNVEIESRRAMLARDVAEALSAAIRTSYAHASISESRLLGVDMGENDTLVVADERGLRCLVVLSPPAESISGRFVELMNQLDWAVRYADGTGDLSDAKAVALAQQLSGAGF